MADERIERTGTATSPEQDSQEDEHPWHGPEKSEGGAPMQVMRICTWLDAGDAMKVIELLDALREALLEEHGDGIETMLRESGQAGDSLTEDEQQGELPLG